MIVRFVFTNPGHHAEMMAPVCRELGARGVTTSMISLAELRGLVTKPSIQDQRVVRAFPAIRTSASSGLPGGEGGGSRLKLIARTALWWGAIAPRLYLLLRDADVIVVPNDAAYPYSRLVPWCKSRGQRVVLLQEGIRFPLPTEQRQGSTYGRSGVDRMCVWGEASARYFTALGVDDARIRVTGNPRLDALDVEGWRARGADLRASLGLARPPLLFLSNPVDDQGFCSTAEKMELFRAFLRHARPKLVADDRRLAVKLHPREDVSAFQQAIAAEGASDRAFVVEQAPFFTVLGAGHAAVVWASTAGLEALLFGLPLGILPLPGHGYVFDYVREKAAHPLSDDAASLRPLLAGESAPGARAFVASHVANRGRAAAAICDVIEALR